MNISPKSIYTWYSNTIRNPKYRWWIILGSIIYLISPFDIAPDFLPIAGQVDDAIVLAMLTTELSRLISDAYTRWRDRTIASSAEKTDTKTVDIDAVSLEK